MANKNIKKYTRQELENMSIEELKRLDSQSSLSGRQPSGGIELPITQPQGLPLPPEPTPPDGRQPPNRTQTPTQPKTLISGKQPSATSQCNDPNSFNYNPNATGCDPDNSIDYGCCEYYIGNISKEQESGRTSRNRTTTFNVSGFTKQEVATKLASKLGVSRQDIDGKLNPYLDSLTNGDHQTEDWWNCQSCGFENVGLCISDNCCTGSAGEGGITIKCKRWVDTSDWFQPE